MKLRRPGGALLIWIGAPVVLLGLVLPGCGGDPPDSGAPWDSSAPGPDGMPVFREITARSGIFFTHHNGATGQRYMPECMGSGVAVIDFDGDGLQDLYFVDSGSLKELPGQGTLGGNQLYRNLGGMTFEEVTRQAGVPGRAYGMGAVVGDYDNDGHPDLYITCFGSNILYHNNGDGTFSDVTRAAGVDDLRWSTGAAFLDFDGDGHLDLFVQNYVDFTLKKHRPCYQLGKLIYCTPDSFDGVPSSLFRNNGDGSFSDVSEVSLIGALPGKGLGVCVADFDDDGRPDIYCANDALMNFLFRNLDGVRFEEMGLESGASHSEDGREEAGMGVDAADLNGDGRLDLIVTNFQFETNAIYRSEGGMAFSEVSLVSGTSSSSFHRLGFGVRFFDFDNDGIQDILVANGHVYDNGLELTPPVPHAQPPTLFRGVGGSRFEDVTDRAGQRFPEPMVARGLALSDLDNDGDLDAVFTTNSGLTRLFENVGGNARSWISIRLVGTKGDSTAIGARVTLAAGGKTQIQEVRSGGSYLSQSDLRIFFGLGTTDRIDALSVRWPDGSVEEVRDVKARQHLTLVQGQGLRR